MTRTVIAAVNFINILRTNFSYEHRFGSFFYIHVTRKKVAKTTFVQKICVYNVDEIDTWMTNLFGFARDRLNL